MQLHPNTYVPFAWPVALPHRVGPVPFLGGFYQYHRRYRLTRVARPVPVELATICAKWRVIVAVQDATRQY
jgi:hypothetical protein